MPHGAGAPPFSKHFDGKRFFNPDAPQARGFLDALRWKLTSHRERSPRFVSDVEQSKPPSRVQFNELRVTLINHSTLLLQQSGSHILTDPIWLVGQLRSPRSVRSAGESRECGGRIFPASIPCSSAIIITIIRRRERDRGCRRDQNTMVTHGTDFLSPQCVMKVSGGFLAGLIWVSWGGFRGAYSVFSRGLTRAAGWLRRGRRRATRRTPGTPGWCGPVRRRTRQGRGRGGNGGRARRPPAARPGHPRTD